MVSANGFSTGSSGILVLGSGNLVEGNKIGTNAAGTAQLANIGNGITIDTGGSDNTIGAASTPGTGAGNIISGNTNQGVLIIDPNTNDNVVAGNLIERHGRW